MKSLKVALLQIMPGATMEENLAKGQAYCRRAKEMGADIALFPEMWSNGYAIPEDMDALRASATPADGAFVHAFGALAKELDMAIAITFLERFEPLPRNTVCIFDRFGSKVLTYAKVHTCDFGEECRLSAGEDFYVADLDTAEGSVKIGAMICYDREFPESARILMLKGAELILVPNACPMRRRFSFSSGERKVSCSASSFFRLVKGASDTASSPGVAADIFSVCSSGIIGELAGGADVFMP